jgi:hypothetical protein
MLPSVTQTTSASRMGEISGLITFTFRLRPGIPSPQLHNSLLPDWVWGSVLRWWLAFPQAGFSPAGEYEFISARLRHSPDPAVSCERKSPTASKRNCVLLRPVIYDVVTRLTQNPRANIRGLVHTDVCRAINTCCAESTNLNMQNT